jgi:putative copper resistance protein D
VDVSGWDVAAVCAKALTYAATLGAAGAVFFLAYSGHLLRDEQRCTIRRLIGVLAAAAATASGLKILLLAGSMSGDFAGMFNGTFANMILGAGEGRTSGMRIAGLALMLFALSANPALRGPSVVGAIIAATSFAWVGHIHGLMPNVAPSLLLCLHLLCAAFWLGALPPLLLIAASGDAQQIAAVAARFGKSALWVVGLLLAAGASLLWTLIGSAAQFWSSEYGAMMAIKLLAVAALLGVAALNRLYLTPRLLNCNTRAAVLFRRWVLVEILVGSIILLTTAAFTTVTGPP